jgi:hypothetical protein
VAPRSFAPTAAVVLIAVLLVAGAARVQAVREARYPPPRAAQDTLYLRSGTAVRRLAGAYRHCLPMRTGSDRFSTTAHESCALARRTPPPRPMSRSTTVTNCSIRCSI